MCRSITGHITALWHKKGTHYCSNSNSSLIDSSNWLDQPRMWWNELAESHNQRLILLHNVREPNNAGTRYYKAILIWSHLWGFMLTFSGKFPVTKATAPTVACVYVTTTVSKLTGPQMIIFIQTEQMVRWYYLRLSRPIMSLYTRERKRKRRGRKRMRRRWAISKIQKGGKVRVRLGSSEMPQ